MILHGDCLDKLKELADNSVDAIVTDPPYGLNFMNKKWDYDVPSTDIWKEALRVLKPGGHMLAFFGTRTYHRGVVRIEDAGFEIRDQIQWIYGSGFPKSHNGVHGGTALKPANEPIVLARKPLIGTVAKNFEQFGVGGLNIDECRIEGAVPSTIQGQSSRQGEIYGPDQRAQKIFNGHAQGRWPANVIFDEEAAAMLDEQSGERKSVPFKSRGGTGNVYQPTTPQDKPEGYSDSGGASRFFYVAKASKRERNAGLEGMPLGEPPKSARSKPAEGRSNALGEMRANHHPTVKPIKLMEYLIKLVTPAGGTVLDPFCGSGSTGVAAKKLGFNFIGIEREKEYVEIAQKRMEAV